MQARELMTTVIESCHAFETLDAAAKKMWDADVGAIPILDDKDRLAGMLTDRDICMATYTQSRAPHEIAIAAVMAKEVHACRPTDSVAQVEKLMRQHQIHRVPVTDGQRHVVGMISMSDLARAASRTHAGEGEVVAALAAISQPRRARDPSQAV